MFFSSQKSTKVFSLEFSSKNMQIFIECLEALCSDFSVDFSLRKMFSLFAIFERKNRSRYYRKLYQQNTCAIIQISFNDSHTSCSMLSLKNFVFNDNNWEKSSISGRKTVFIERKWILILLLSSKNSLEKLVKSRMFLLLRKLNDLFGFDGKKNH
jgi:hypothetical protein